MTCTTWMGGTKGRHHTRGRVPLGWRCVSLQATQRCGHEHRRADVEQRRRSQRWIRRCGLFADPGGRCHSVNVCCLISRSTVLLPRVSLRFRSGNACTASSICPVCASMHEVLAAYVEPLSTFCAAAICQPRRSILPAQSDCLLARGDIRCTADYCTLADSWPVAQAKVAPLSVVVSPRA